MSRFVPPTSVHDRGWPAVLARLREQLDILADRRGQDDQIDLADVRKVVGRAIDGATAQRMRLDRPSIDADDPARRPSFSQAKRDGAADEAKACDGDGVKGGD